MALDKQPRMPLASTLYPYPIFSPARINDPDVHGPVMVGDSFGLLPVSNAFAPTDEHVSGWLLSPALRLAHRTPLYCEIVVTNDHECSRIAPTQLQGMANLIPKAFPATAIPKAKGWRFVTTIGAIPSL